MLTVAGYLYRWLDAYKAIQNSQSDAAPLIEEYVKLFISKCCVLDAKYSIRYSLVLLNEAIEKIIQSGTHTVFLSDMAMWKVVEAMAINAEYDDPIPTSHREYGTDYDKAYIRIKTRYLQYTTLHNALQSGKGAVVPYPEEDKEIEQAITRKQFAKAQTLALEKTRIYKRYMHSFLYEYKKDDTRPIFTEFPSVDYTEECFREVVFPDTMYVSFAFTFPDVEVPANTYLRYDTY